jgi:hypothetical protein
VDATWEERIASNYLSRAGKSDFLEIGGCSGKFLMEPHETEIRSEFGHSRDLPRGQIEMEINE